VLLVEADAVEAWEVQGLRKLLEPSGVRVEAAGGHEAVRAAGAAFPKLTLWDPGTSCYTIIDRDHRGDDEVESTWDGGPFADGRCGLIWRRHEFESYFLEPELLTKSAHFRSDRGVDRVWQHLLKAARQRVLMDAANLVLKEAREATGRWGLCELSPSDGDFRTVEAAEVALLGAHDYAATSREKRRPLTAKWLRSRFHAWVKLLIEGNGATALAPGRGQWLQRMAGKELLGEVISGQFFRVPSFVGDTPILSQQDLVPVIVGELMERSSGAPGVPDQIEPPADLAAVRDYFRDTQPRRFGLTGTAESPPSQ
jgi:hypothetical protein